MSKPKVKIITVDMAISALLAGDAANNAERNERESEYLAGILKCHLKMKFKRGLPCTMRNQ